MDAQWTRINRGRVSPEVLERAGVRYEARPTYVAVLGRLTKEQVEDFARQSADVRRARELRQASPPSKYQDRRDSKSSRDEEEDEDSDLWDSSDSTDIDDDKTSVRGTKSYPYIVNPPQKEKGSPSATVQPKSILKNKNEHHVRFGPDPYEVEYKSPRSFKDDRDRDRRRRYHDDRTHNDRERDRDRHSRRYYDDRDREYSSRRAQRAKRDHRDDRDEHRDRPKKKKAWGEALGAVGIGGAAVSLLSVLAEAASNV
jgi:hypothetical protein